MYVVQAGSVIGRSDRSTLIAPHEPLLRSVSTKEKYWLVLGPLTFLAVRVQSVLQSVLCTRLLLHLHVITASLPEQPTATEFSTVGFTETIESLRNTSYRWSLSSAQDPRWLTLPISRHRRRILQSDVD